MKIFLGKAGGGDRRLRIAIRRADSDPCLPTAKVAALFCGREANSPGIQFSAAAVARKIRHAIT